MAVHSKERLMAAIAALSAKRGEIRAFRLSRLSRNMYETMTERELMRFANAPDMSQNGPLENQRAGKSLH